MPAFFLAFFKYFYGAITSPTSSLIILLFFLLFLLGLRWAGQVALGLALLPTPHIVWTPLAVDTLGVCLRHVLPF